MKKVVSLLLVLVLALGMSTVAFATPTANGRTGKPTELTTAGAGRISAKFNTDIGLIAADTDVRYTFVPGDFKWDDDANATPGGVRMTEIDKGKVKISVKVKEGKALFDSAEIKKDNQVSRMQIAFKEKFLVTSDSTINFEAETTMSVGGKKANGSGDDVWTLTGYYDPEEAGMILEPESDDEGDDISKGEYVDPQGYNPKWVGVLDEDGVMEGTFKLFKGRKFYMFAEEDIADEDAETVDYFGFDTVWNVTYSANAVSSLTSINFVDLSDSFYVYGSKSGAALKGKADVAKDLVYLGTSASDLPLYSKYYLATKQIDVDYEDVTDEPSDIDAPVLSDDGGGDGYIANVNDNPGTGK